MELTDELIQVYYASQFHVYWAKETIVLPGKGKNTSLLDLHAKFGVTCSSLITAYNPFSVPTEESVNQHRLEKLKGEVSKRWPYLAAKGIDPEGVWQSEPSIYVLGISLPEVLKLGRQFNQHAVLYAEGDRINLFACDPEKQALFNNN